MMVKTESRKRRTREPKKYHVTLTPEERSELDRLVSAGKAAARKLAHARVLLKADEAEGGPGWGDEQIAEALDVGLSTVARVRQRFVEQGLEAALVRKPTSRTYARRLDGKGEAHLVALACSKPPAGRKRWTLQLLADRVVALGHAEELSYETVRRVLKKTRPSPG
jgi:transposase